MKHTIYKLINNHFYSFLLFLVFFGCTSYKVNNLALSSYKITGESFVLKNSDENRLIKNNISNLVLYSIGSKRERIYYKENVDYVVVNNRVKRTINSSIPNFAGHDVLVNQEGTFTFSSSPRNPSLTIPFHVYADYDFQDIETVYGEFNKSFLSTKLKEKLRNKENIKFGAIGTSITAGVHTLESFHFDSDKQTYPYLIAKAIKGIYGNDVYVNNYSQGGSSIGYLETIFETVLQDHVDLVFIEFGMNDHISSSWESGLLNFELSISAAIEKFQANNIDVILVGFFQQNPSWDLEFDNSTITYNQSLYNLANKHNCYFANINKEFSKYNQTKINQDLCGDFMHHPTSFGHLLLL